MLLLLLLIFLLALHQLSKQTSTSSYPSLLSLYRYSVAVLPQISIGGTRACVCVLLPAYRALCECVPICVRARTFLCTCVSTLARLPVACASQPASGSVCMCACTGTQSCMHAYLLPGIGRRCCRALATRGSCMRMCSLADFAGLCLSMRTRSRALLFACVSMPARIPVCTRASTYMLIYIVPRRLVPRSRPTGPCHAPRAARRCWQRLAGKEGAKPVDSTRASLGMGRHGFFGGGPSRFNRGFIIAAAANSVATALAAAAAEAAVAAAVVPPLPPATAATQQHPWSFSFASISLVASPSSGSAGAACVGQPLGEGSASSLI